MKFNEELLDRVFDQMEDYLQDPIQPDEFTVQDMVDKYPDYSQVTWRRKLKKAAKDGLYEMRKAEGNILAFKLKKGAD